jgi:hypothetical protein
MPKSELRNVLLWYENALANARKISPQLTKLAVRLAGCMCYSTHQPHIGTAFFFFANACPAGTLPKRIENKRSKRS